MEAKIFLLFLIVTMEIVSGVKQEQRPTAYNVWTQYHRLITPGSIMARSNADDCGGQLNMESGQIQSPGFPETYENNESCVWQITNPEGSPVVLFFSQPIEIENSTSCNFDYVEIRDGSNDTARMLGKFCGDQKPPIITSTGNHLWIKFKSNGFNTAKGFEATFRKDCPQIITAIIPGNPQFSGNYVKSIEGGDGKNDYRNYIVYRGVNALNGSCIWWNEGNHWWIGSCNSSPDDRGFAYSPHNPASSCPTDHSNSMDWIAADGDIPIDGFMIKEVVYCCYAVKVAFDSGFFNTHGAHLAHPAIYQDYNMEPGLVKGKNHYISSDGKYALSFCGVSWWIQSAAQRGKCAGFAYSSWKTPNCVNYVGYDWKYYVSSVNDFVPAKQGLIVECLSKRW